LQTALASCRISTPKTTTAPLTTPTSTTTTRAVSARRPFSTTYPAAQQLAVPPESSKFITIPEPPQSSEPRLPPLKGHLPVPRDIFPKRDGNRKAKTAFLEAAMPLSKAEVAGDAPKSDAQARHRELAASRRTAYAAGIQGLYQRKKARVAKSTARSEARRRANLAAATAPEPLDEILTRGSIRAATALDTAVRPDPDRFAKAEAARARFAEQEALKAEARRDHLAQLYVAAGDFIVSEAELEARVNAVFTADRHRYGGIGAGESIWNTSGAPANVAQMQSVHSGTSTNAMEVKKAASFKTAERQKLVAEELTGGKL
jgi:hypothetical protein